MKGDILKGTVRGAIYPARMQGQTIEVRVEDEAWGRCDEYSTWVRLEDIEPIPELVQPVSLKPLAPVYSNWGTLTNFTIDDKPYLAIDPAPRSIPPTNTTFSMQYKIKPGPEADSLMALLTGTMNEEREE
jgi:hypothetical protein